jgi:hypothetical protein
VAWAEWVKEDIKENFMHNMRHMAEQLQRRGTGGDDILAHINPAEAMQLARQYGGSMNPQTGLPEFGFFGKLWSGFKKISPLASGIENVARGQGLKGFARPYAEHLRDFGPIIGKATGTVFGGPGGGAAGGALGQKASDFTSGLLSRLDDAEAQKAQMEQMQQMPQQPEQRNTSPGHYRAYMRDMGMQDPYQQQMQQQYQPQQYMPQMQQPMMQQSYNPYQSLGSYGQQDMYSGYNPYEGY